MRGTGGRTVDTAVSVAFTVPMQLDRAARLRLMKFVCSFCWTDLRVQQAERDLVMRIAGHLHLDDAETEQVRAWLRVPPPAEELDPASIPRAQRELVLAAAQKVVEADGRVVPAERDALATFRDLLR